MGKTEVENLDLKNKLNIVSGIIANTKKDLETKETIKNNIELIYAALKKLPKESQSKLTELVRLDTILNTTLFMRGI